jgi:general secretion pathway protein K
LFFTGKRAESERNGEKVAKPDWYSGGGNSEVYMIIAEAMIADGISEKIMAIMKQGEANNGLPFEILKWVEDYPVTSREAVIGLIFLFLV